MDSNLTLDDFRQSLTAQTPPTGLELALLALWYEAKGDWTRAHGALQDDGSAEGAWVHAYLHRVEGDPGNAAYWYRRADRPVSQQSLADEWTAIAQQLLDARS
jgi:hypothetical protein